MARLVPLVVILTVIIIIVFLAGRSRLKSDSDQIALNSGEPGDIGANESVNFFDGLDMMGPAPRVNAGASASVFDGLDMMGPAPRVNASASVFDGLDMMGPAPRVNAGVGGLDGLDILRQMIQSDRNLDGTPKSLSDKAESVQNVNDIIDARIAAIDQEAAIAEAILTEQTTEKTAQLTELARVENARLAEEFRVQQNAYTSKMSQFQLDKEQKAVELGDLSKSISDTRLKQIQFKNNVLNVQTTSELERLIEKKRVDTLLDALDGMDDVEDERIRIEGEFADFTAVHDLLELEAIEELDDATDAIAEYELEIVRVNGEIEGELQEARNLDTTFENDQSELFGGVAQDIEGWGEIYNGEDGDLNDDGLYFDPVGKVWAVAETQSSQNVAISASRDSAESQKDTLEGLRNSLTDLAQSKKDADEVGLGLAKDIADARTVDTTTNAVLRVEEDLVDGNWGPNEMATWECGPVSDIFQLPEDDENYPKMRKNILGVCWDVCSNGYDDDDDEGLSCVPRDGIGDSIMKRTSLANRRSVSYIERAVDQSSSESAKGIIDGVDRSTFETRVGESENLYAAESATIAGGVNAQYSDASASRGGTELADMGDDRMMQICMVSANATWGTTTAGTGEFMPDEACSADLLSRRDVKRATFAESYTDDPGDLDDMLDLTRPMMGCVPQSVYQNANDSRMNALGAEMEDVTEAEKWNDCLKFFKTIPVGVEPVSTNQMKFDIYCDSSPNDPIPPVDCYGEWDTSDCKNPLLTIYDFGVLEDLGTKTWNVKFDPMFGGTCPHADGHTAKCVKGDKSSEARDEYEMGQGMIGGMLGL